MRSEIVSCAAVLALAVLVFIPEGVQSDCCHSTGGFCPDCNQAGPENWYCGVGDCNVFGCNCDYGCKQGPCVKKRSIEDPVNGIDGVEVENGHDVVRLADTDADGALNVTEVKLFLGRRGVVVEIDAFRVLDVDGDGKLTAREIDADLLYGPSTRQQLACMVILVQASPKTVPRPHGGRKLADKLASKSQSSPPILAAFTYCYCGSVKK